MEVGRKVIWNGHEGKVVMLTSRTVDGEPAVWVRVANMQRLLKISDLTVTEEMAEADRVTTVEDWLLAEIDEGYSLIATREKDEDGETCYAVWVDYGTKTSSGPYEGVTQDELDAVVKLHPDKVYVREYEDRE